MENIKMSYINTLSLRPGGTAPYMQFTGMHAAGWFESEGLSSLQETPQVAQKLKNVMNNMGSTGHRMRVYNDRGEEMTGWVNIGGRMWQQPEGGLRTWSETNVMEKVKIRRQIAEIVDQQLELALLGDEIAADLLGMNYETFQETMQPGQVPGTLKLKPGLIAGDARPDFIKTKAGHEARLGALKLKSIIEQLLAPSDKDWGMSMTKAMNAPAVGDGKQDYSYIPDRSTTGRNRQYVPAHASDQIDGNLPH
jgi:hypothetical protein